mmetsp:Transcript_19706/g.40175  ORF Transcript_19706/g.40175 Transcript_19706/m.40175 type:complete len:201 (-) Transcript_19706:337-939(-)|eukprot:CAMPEP_0181314886 /NCGR_PEP_ID=MMETSP1101-20121128/15065_1 /TAXON_ID=46948 /ORGANISM="Rhodomonas abbreviata, Strain Caron Lab Isolate" /LENGTH=200 /DNA_ID=CAMNT_0023422025 /DNA_START=106 /DNA_END=708 /DNA_ORIENTATION=+
MASEIRAKIQQERIFARLRELKKDIKSTLGDCHQALENTSGHLVEYFRRIPESEMSGQIKMRFESWDRDNSGALDRSELMEAMAELGKRPTDEEMDQFMEEFDLDGSGTIELDEFEHMVRVHLCISTKNCICQLCQAYAAEMAEEEGSDLNSTLDTSGAFSRKELSTTSVSAASVVRPGSRTTMNKASQEDKDKLPNFKF